MQCRPIFAATLAMLTLGATAVLGVNVMVAQTSMPPNQVSPFHDTTPVKTPPGARVAVYDFEDLECPACAHAFPFTHAAVAKYHIPLVRHDFPLHMHVWSHEAAVYARYMQDTISPEFAEDYRRQVFATQTAIATKDDLINFTRKYMSAHGKQMPFALDPKFTKEVDADYALGEKIGLVETPTIFVVDNKGTWIQVKDADMIEPAIQDLLAATKDEKTVARRK
jgi:protein-disulfide isomerase